MGLDQSLCFIRSHHIATKQENTALLLPCSHRWSLGSRRRQWPLVPSSKVCRWRCSYAQQSCPTEHSLQNRLNVDEGIRGVMNVRQQSITYSIPWRSREVFVIPSLTSAFSVSSTFWPLMSLWMTLWAWRWERPWAQVKKTEVVGQ